MQTSLTDEMKGSALGQEADAILRSCVHCGFCTATCPTYQLLNDELDGPRGRIYLIKQLLEGEAITEKTQQHLDRCLTCRSCETTCPSGVRYARLLEIGRHFVEEKVPRPLFQRLQRKALRLIVPYPERVAPLLTIARIMRPLLPKSVKKHVAPASPVMQPSFNQHQRKMLLLDGCAQKALTPQTNVAATRLLDRLGITLAPAAKAGCCGALSQHLSAEEEALAFMRRNIDAWWPEVEAGCEAIIITASGCGTTIKEYGALLQHDSHYAEKAARVSALARDISEVIAAEDLSTLGNVGRGRKIVFQSPCSLQHGQQLAGVVEGVLSALGFELQSYPDGHLCCGSAGSYSILQKELSQQLLENKVSALQSSGAELITTANVGCQLHIASRAGLPVRHWLELLDRSSD